MCAAEEDLEFAGKRGSGALSMGERVRKAIDALEAEGQIPSFYRVAERAAVARSTLYRNKALRVCIEEARERFSAQGDRSAESPEPGDGSQRNFPLRAEVDALREALAVARGERDALERKLAMRCALEGHRMFNYGVCRTGDISRRPPAHCS